MTLRKTVFAIAIAAGAVGFMPAFTSAQEQPMVEVPTAKNTAVGEINALAVNVRSGPAESYYPTIQLNKGDRVTVVGHKFEWLKIIPPQGSFSYIAKVYVERNGAGTAGKVNSDGVLIRAGSSLNQLMTQSQLTVGKDFQVEIIGEANEYYKITPPQGAYLYVAKKFVDLVPAAVAGATTAPAANATVTAAITGTTPAAEGATAAEGPKTAEPRKASVKKAEAKPAESEPGVSADAEADFRKLELQFEQSKEQPLENRPIAEMLKGYEAQQSNQQLSSTSRRMAEFRAQYLKAVLDQQQELIKAKQSDADFQAKQAVLEAEAKKLEQRMKDAGIAVYSAVGQLTTSAVQKDGQPMMRLVDPADNRTLVYVHILDAKERGLVGKFVGVRGPVATDAALGIDVIEPTLVEPVDQAKVLKGVTAKIFPPSITRGTAE